MARAKKLRRKLPGVVTLKGVLDFAHYAAHCMVMDAECEVVKHDDRLWINTDTAKKCFGDSLAYLRDAELLERHPDAANLVRVAKLPWRTQADYDFGMQCGYEASQGIAPGRVQVVRQCGFVPMDGWGKTMHPCHCKCEDGERLCPRHRALVEALGGMEAAYAEYRELSAREVAA